MDLFGRSEKATREFTRKLAMLLKSDVPLHTGVELIGWQQTNKRWARALQQVSSNLRAGEPLSQALLCRGLAFKPGYIQTLAWAEHKGRLKDLLIALHLLAGDYAPVMPEKIYEASEAGGDPEMLYYVDNAGGTRSRRR
jgi:type II secretory pathway component PulF